MKIKNIATAFLVTCALCALVGCGEKKVEEKPKTFDFQRIGLESGLPSNDITCLASFGGKVWAGSNKGLYIFDGVNWAIQCVKNNNLLGSDKIVSLQSLNNCIWIGTDSGACYNDGNNYYAINTPGGRARAVSGNINEQAVGTAYGVVRGGNTFSSSSAGIVSDEITQLIYDNNNNLWIGTKFGMSKLEGGVAQNFTGKAKQVMGSSLTEIPPSPPNCKLPGNFIKSIIRYNGMLAIGTTEGLCVTDMNNYYDVYTAEHKDWMMSKGTIIEAMVRGNCDMPGNKVKALATTENSELLFVVTDLGLGILKGKEWLKVDTLIPGLPTDGLASVAWCNGDLWLGTEDDGLILVKGISSLITASAKENK